MSALIVRGVGSIVVIVAGALFAAWMGLGIVGAFALDVVLVLLVGGPVAAVVGVKSIIPATIAAVILPRIFPAPNTAAAVFSATVVAATFAGLIWYVVRARRMLRTREGWQRMHRTALSLACLAAAATAEIAVAGLALTMGHLEPAYITATIAPALVWLTAYRLQTTPTRRPVRDWLAGLFHDMSGRTGLAAGAR